MTFRVINRFENCDDLFMCYLIQLADSFYRTYKFESFIVWLQCMDIKEDIKKET